MKQIRLNRPPGATSQIGGWLGALTEAREDLLGTLTDLTDQELHTELLPGAHSIAAILWHMANIELWWIQTVLQGTPPDEATRRRFGLTEPGEFNTPPDTMSLAQFLALMAEARQATVAAYGAMTDEAFTTADRLRPGGQRIYAPEWILFNLVDHEANHRGQIAMLKRLLRQRTA